MRDSYLDTNKALLIFLVVFGHFLERLIGWENPINHRVLAMIYLIHMPAFIFISGLFFKDQNWIKNILLFISLYIPFQILFPAFEAIWSGRFQLHWNIFERPYWILWYLMAMIMWTTLTHFLIKIKFPVCIAIFLALIIGLSPWNNYQYSLGRVFVFLPFFIVGHVYGTKIIQFIQQFKYALVLSFCIVIGFMGLVYCVSIHPFWLYGSLSYRQLNVSAISGIWIRMGCLILSSLGIFVVFSLAKVLKQGFVQLGRNTLAVYLLHGFIVITISQYLTLDLNIVLQIMMCLLLSVLSCWLLQQNFFDSMLRTGSRWLLIPVEKLFKNK